MQLRIGNRTVEIDRIENGVPVIKADAEEITRPDGSKDVIVRIPCLNMSAKEN
jgi:hypothetical protein